jgi:hypothetical protein
MPWSPIKKLWRVSPTREPFLILVCFARAWPASEEHFGFKIEKFKSIRAWFVLLVLVVLSFFLFRILRLLLLLSFNCIIASSSSSFQLHLCRNLDRGNFRSCCVLLSSSAFIVMNVCNDNQRLKRKNETWQIWRRTTNLVTTVKHGILGGTGLLDMQRVYFM